MLNHPQLECPPHKMYAFDGGWNLTWQVVDTLARKAKKQALLSERYIHNVIRQARYEDVVTRWIGDITLFLVAIYAIVQYLVLHFALFLFFIAHTLLLVALIILSLPPIGLLRFCAWLYNRCCGIYYRCPW